jgi:hypothetical protein
LRPTSERHSLNGSDSPVCRGGLKHPHMAIAAVILEFIDGPEKGRTVSIADFGPTLLGRGGDADIRLPAVDSSLSRHQAYVELSRDGCELLRVSGSNRVVEVNHRDVDSQCTLADGDVVRLGVTVLRVAIVLTDTACIICGKVVEDGSQVDWDDHADVSVRAHEGCVDQVRASHEQFGDYEACERIGDASTRELYQVYDRKTHRIWVLRRLTDMSSPSHFESNVQQLIAIRHPNIIRCVKGGVDQDGVPFTVTEFARDGNIADFVGRRKSSDMALSLIDDVLEALKFLHALGKAHGDLHPRSIVVQRQARGVGIRPRAKLVDVGVTNRLRGDGPPTSKWQWSAPEHSGGDVHDHRDDVYATAAVLYSLLAPQLLVQAGDTGNPSAGGSGFIERVPRAAECPTIRPGVASAIDRACHKDPARRFRSAQELQDALRAGSNRC